MAIDFVAIFGAEEYDPCAALVALRPAVMELRLGGAVTRIKFRDRDTEFARADLDGLTKLITQLESECAAKRGRAPTRHAITAGYRADRWGDQ